MYVWIVAISLHLRNGGCRRHRTVVFPGVKLEDNRQEQGTGIAFW